MAAEAEGLSAARDVCLPSPEKFCVTSARQTCLPPWPRRPTPPKDSYNESSPSCLITGKLSLPEQHLLLLLEVSATTCTRRGTLQKRYLTWKRRLRERRRRKVRRRR